MNGEGGHPRDDGKEEAARIFKKKLASLYSERDVIHWGAGEHGSIK